MSGPGSRKRNIFVLGMTDLQREELGRMRHAGRYTVRSLLDYQTLVRDTDHDFEELLDQARAQLADFSEPIDAIVCHWDFPSSLLAPVLSHELGIPAPSVTSVLKCEHKYWSRLDNGDGWRVEVVTRTVLTSTATDFLINAQLDAYELDEEQGNPRVYSQNWQRRIARDLV